MPRGISLHVGINEYSSAFPGAQAQQLEGCVNDATEMQRIAVAKGFEQCDILLNADATYMRVTTKIRAAAAQLQTDDIFFFSFAGHGFQAIDQPPHRDESDLLDETLLLFDAELYDDVLRKELWPLFKPGVRILMVADSCHSGTAHAVPTPPDDNVAVVSKMDDFPVIPGGARVRSIDRGIIFQHHAEYGEFYRRTLLPLTATINANLLALPACADSKTTADGVPNGAYTKAMLEVLRDSDPADYKILVEQIETKLPNQGVRCREINPRPDFIGQKPFTV